MLEWLFVTQEFILKGGVVKKLRRSRWNTGSIFVDYLLSDRVKIDTKGVRVIFEGCCEFALIFGYCREYIKQKFRRKISILNSSESGCIFSLSTKPNNSRKAS